MKINLVLKDFTEEQAEIFINGYEAMFPDKYNYSLESNYNKAIEITPNSVKSFYYNRISKERLEISQIEFELIDFLFSFDKQTIYLASNFILKNSIGSPIFMSLGKTEKDRIKFQKLSFAYIEYIKYFGADLFKEVMFQSYDSSIYDFYFTFIVNHNSNYYSNKNLYNDNIYLNKTWSHFNEYLFAKQ
jgi:hypothetical protein